MKVEIERKFLVKSDGWRENARDVASCRQGYFCTGSGNATVRVRLMGGKGFLTIKGPSEGISRAELEYEIPPTDAEYMLDHLCGGRIVTKKRYILIINGLRWEIDEFSGAHQGLVLAEIELDHEDQFVELPDWIEEEVSLDHNYTNVFLASNPYKKVC